MEGALCVLAADVQCCSSSAACLLALAYVLREDLASRVGHGTSVRTPDSGEWTSFHSEVWLLSGTFPLDQIWGNVSKLE